MASRARGRGESQRWARAGRRLRWPGPGGASQSQRKRPSSVRSCSGCAFGPSSKACLACAPQQLPAQLPRAQDGRPHAVSGGTEERGWRPCSLGSCSAVHPAPRCCGVVRRSVGSSHLLTVEWQAVQSRGRVLEEKEREWKGPFYFIQGADPQFGLMKAWSTGDYNSSGDEWEQEIRLTEHAVQAINKLNPKPKFFVLCGDLIHAMPGTPWRKEQTKDLQRVLGAVDREIPLVFVSGNHDVGNVPTAETIEEFCQTWGDDYFSFWVGGVLFLVLNSQLLYDASRCPTLKQAQDLWLDQQLSLAGQRRCQHAIVFQHIPLFLQSIDEDDDYFNLTRSVRKEMADKFTKAGVRAVFSGHYHRNAGGTYENLDMVVSSAIGCQLGKDTHGLRVVVVTAEKIVHRYYSLDELSEKGMEDDLMELMKQQ
ncbi:serine/threonine-protein phosphatase CPPED1 isoform X2 [Sciurus carolinensis]|uniref:serine/threonine-protein phosphatase CPPED1 isoform X2 n=1 Tax=Sciurus carolinensis TaxID=30640 RepID=UPI001FB4E355|nr:serine/threonine-protein phosphatase CPPED1 isoform X2 [Sciurus carolinensis]